MPIPIQSNWNNFPEELRTLIQQGWEMFWGRNTDEAGALLERFQDWTDSVFWNDWLLRLIRGTLYIIEEQEELAKEELQAILKDPSSTADSRVLALMRLIIFSYVEDNFEEAEQYVQATQKIIDTEDVDNLAKAEYLFQRGNSLSYNTERSDEESLGMQKYHNLAGTLFAHLGLEQRWWASRKLYVDINLEFDYQIQQLELEAQQYDLDIEELRKEMVDKTLTGFVNGHPHGKSWLLQLENAHLYVPLESYFLLGHFYFLHEEEDKAMWIWNLILEESTDENDIWITKVHILDCSIREGVAPLSELEDWIEHRYQDVEHEYLLYLLTASKFLMDHNSILLGQKILEYLIEQTEDETLIVSAKINLVGIYFSLQQLSKAMSLRRTFSLDDIDDLEMKTICKMNDASISFQLGLFEEFAEVLPELLRDLPILGDPHQIAMLLNNALSLLEHSEYLKDFAEELRVLLPRLSASMRLRCLLTLVKFESQESEAYIGEEPFRELSEEAKKQGQMNLVALAHILHWHHYCTFLEITEESGREFLITFQQLTTCSPHQQLGNIYSILGDIHEILGDTKLAIEYFHKTIQEAQQSGQVHLQASNLEQLYLTLPNEEGKEYARKAITLMNSISCQASSDYTRGQVAKRTRFLGNNLIRDAMDNQMWNEALNIIFEVKAGIFLRESALNKNLEGINLEALKKSNQQIQKLQYSEDLEISIRNSFSVNSPIFTEENQLISNECLPIVDINMVQDFLKEDELVLEYYVDLSTFTICIFTITKNELNCYQHDLSPKEIDYLTHIDDITSGKKFKGKWRSAQRALRTVYKIMIEPFEGYLDRYQRIWFAKGTVLGHVPLSALLDSQERFLIEKLEIRVLSSAAQLVGLPEQSRTWKQYGLFRGDDENQDFLLAADAECLDVQKIFQEHNLQSIVIESEASFNDMDIFHYAGHASYDLDEQRLYLSLQNKILFAEEFAQLPLKPGGLVVLSACSTSVQIGFALSGFIRSAFLAGISSLVCSNWPAADQATRYLMSHFYKNLMNGKSPSQALRAAILAMPDERDNWKHPFYWANFECYGVG